MNVFRGQTQTCHRSEYWTGRECCPMCPAGNRVKTDCTEFRSTSCLPCTEGTYMNRANGLRQCLMCKNCNEGSGLKIRMSCTTTADAVCEALEGFFCIDFTDDHCAEAQKHRRCKPGQYISQTGTSSRDTECSDCRDGTFSNGTLTSCQPHTQCESLSLQLIKAGTVSTDAECGEQSSDKTGTVALNGDGAPENIRNKEQLQDVGQQRVCQSAIEQSTEPPFVPDDSVEAFAIRLEKH
ncbi:tumor necrosis factor receptor superfamily member 14-like [Symphorus nematophorus]